MANTESDATYCSEAEKDILSQRRRSKRLAEKLTSSFRLKEDPCSQRFEEIHQMLKSGADENWSTNDWTALQFEVRFLKKSMKGVARPKVAFVDKKIREHLQRPGGQTESNNLCANVEDEIPSEVERSPNILAGMTTETFTELPLYQPEKTINSIRMINDTSRASVLTQANPLDLTKKSFEIQEERESINLVQEADVTRVVNVTIDLTEDPLVGKSRANPETPTHTSKWLKYVQSQKQKALNGDPNTTFPQRDKSVWSKKSLRKLFTENPTSRGDPTGKSGKRASPKSHSAPRDKILPSVQPQMTSKQQKIPSTEWPLRLDYELAEKPQRSIQTERLISISPISFADDLPFLGERADDASSTSLPPSLKQSFKKIFGTDRLNDVLGCEKIIYSLTERHVERLASSLKLKKDSLKRTIEQVLLDDDFGRVEDDVGSGSSVVECSQSPTQRLFPSQRSQKSK